MNNALAIAFRLPCRGLRTPAQWAQASHDASRRTFISSALARERHQWLSRGFTSTSWHLAKKLKPAQKKQSEKSPKARTPLGAQGKAARVVNEIAKKPEKAQVQLSKAQVATILGSGLTFDQGMELLQELQYRRVTGSLSDKGIEFPERAEYTQDHRSRALEWLRETYPVDEEAASFEYAEELAAKEREELQERARKLRIYKRDEDAEQTEEEKAEEIYVNEEYDKIPLRPDQTADITSGSALAARKEYVEASRKKAKIEAEKVAQEYEAQGIKPPEPYKGHDLVVAKKTALEDTRKIKHEKWEKLAQEAELDVNEVQAERSAFSRLWAPVAFGVAVAGLSYIYAEKYEPPKSSMRVFPSISPGTATICAIAGLNLVIWLMWRHPHAWKFMNRNFMLSTGSPKAFSVLGGLFSHQNLQHWMWNMASLWIVGSLVHTEIGRGQFLSLYLTSGITGYLSSLIFFVLSGSYLSATLGASAAIFGVAGAYFTISPTRTFTLPDILGGQVEYWAWVPLVLMFGLEVVRWRAGRGIVDGAMGSGTDHMSHLGGMAAGAVYGLIIRKRIEKERGEDVDRLPQKTLEKAVVPASVIAPSSGVST